MKKMVEEKYSTNLVKTKYVNDSKITDHYAIIPTGQGFENYKGLSELQANVYKLIVRRFLAIFYPPAEYNKINVTVNVENETFLGTGKVCIKRGFLDVLRPEKKQEKEIKKYEATPSMSPEIGIIRNYIDVLFSLPWNKQTKDFVDLKKVKKTLDSSHYGLLDIKDRILEYLAVKKRSVSQKAPIICLVGPPGVGKTSLAKSIAIATNRKFAKISVGGVNDPAEIIGHRRTYMGANPGRIINALRKCESKNPVFLIDEIDKMTKDIKGDPASSLLEVLDPEQNKTFYDNYVEEPFDLSKVLFILTANYIDQIPEELKDRLEIISLSSYTEYEKLSIAKCHLIKKALEEYKLDSSSIKFSDEVILNIIEKYTKESGVRELDRVINKIIRKCVRYMVENKKNSINVEITNDNLESYLGKQKYYNMNFCLTTPLEL